MSYSILVRNEQGASDGTTRDTIKECKAWLENDWTDPERLSAVIKDQHGEIVATKPIGGEWE